MTELDGCYGRISLEGHRCSGWAVLVRARSIESRELLGPVVVSCRSRCFEETWERKPADLTSMWINIQQQQLLTGEMYDAVEDGSVSNPQTITQGYVTGKDCTKVKLGGIWCLYARLTLSYLYSSFTLKLHIFNKSRRLISKWYSVKLALPMHGHQARDFFVKICDKRVHLNHSTIQTSCRLIHTQQLSSALLRLYQSNNSCVYPDYCRSFGQNVLEIRDECLWKFDSDAEIDHISYVRSTSVPWSAQKNTRRPTFYRWAAWRSHIIYNKNCSISFCKRRRKA